MRIRLLVLVVCLSAPIADAQLSRSAVSVNGLDTNPCSVQSPCRSVTQALSQTNPSGELIILDSAGYGGFAITKAVSIESPLGVYAGVTVTSGNAITINAGVSDRIVLRGLTLNGLATAASGIVFTGGKILHIENCVIDGFTQYAVFTTFDTAISDTQIRHCGSGISIDNAGASIIGSVSRVEVKDVSGGGQPYYPGAGVLAYRNAYVIARDTLVMNAGGDGFVADGGQLSVESCQAIGNTRAVHAGSHYGGTKVKVSNTISTLNGYGWVADTGTIFVTFGNNRNVDNFAPDSGAITPMSMN